MSALTKLKNILHVNEAAIGLHGWDDFMRGNPAPDWVQALRMRAQEKFAATGLPTARSERFKYTNLAALLKNAAYDFAATDIKNAGTTQYTKTIAELLQGGIPDWVQQMMLATPAGEMTYNDMMLWHAANAFLRDGIALDIPKNTVAEMPLVIDITGRDGTCFVPRSFVRVGENSEFTIIENHTGQGEYWNNRVTQIHLEKGARLRHYRLQDNAADAAYTQNTHVTIDRDAGYEAFVLTKGAGISRNQIHVDLAGENASVRLAGINLLRGSQFADTTITIEHQAPHCPSNQSYKSILDDKARCVFQGKVHVHQVAQKTDGYQLANTLLLSPNAEMYTKPELEIYADDVKCSHGATTGQMDTGPLFYLRTRGLSEAQAKMLLMQAFLGPALEEIGDDDVREQFGAIAFEWLRQQAEK